MTDPDTRRALFQRALAKKGLARRAEGGIPRRAPGAPVPASFLQEGMWFIEQLEPGLATYNVPAAIHLHGALDANALENALLEIIRRHEAVRAAFVMQGSELRQVFREPHTFRVARHSLEHLPPGERVETARRLASTEAQTPMSLADSPLFRASLLSLQPDHHVLLITIHHIVTDGWSMGVLARELQTLYAAFRDGRPSPLPPLPVQFGDYATWQRETLQGAGIRRLQDYWRDKLAGSSFVLNLPWEAGAGDESGPRGRHIPVEIAQPQSGALRSLCRAAEATLFAALLSAFACTLAALAGQDDLLIGTPVANRNHRELEDLIGYFVNLLPIRVQAAGGLAFTELVRQVSRTVAEANDHQEMPFGRIVELVQPPRLPGHNPLFQVEFTLLDPRHAPPIYGYGFQMPLQRALDWHGLSIEPLETESGVSKFDLTMLLWDMGDGIRGTLEYNTAYLSGGVIEQVRAAFGEAVAQVCAAPGMTVAALRERLARTLEAARRVQRAGRKEERSRGLKSAMRRAAGGETFEEHTET
jgi:hypothetical protein